jgi:hypothetical protein
MARSRSYHFNDNICAIGKIDELQQCLLEFISDRDMTEFIDEKVDEA